jgi:hypothetical protein
MAWIYFQVLEGSGSHYRLGSEPFVIANEIDMHKAFFCPECDQVTLIRPLFGTMSQPYELSCCQGLSLSARDFPVRTYQLRAVERAWQESEVVFSSRSQDSSESADQLSFFSKTSLPSEPVEGKRWLKNWPRSGMTVGGLLYQPPQLEPHTNEIDGFYLPTPTFQDACGRDRHNQKNGTTILSLLGVARKLEQKTNGPLNPNWNEWLMGYPMGWTEINALATAWFRPKSGKRLKNSQG